MQQTQRAKGVRQTGEAHAFQARSVSIEREGDFGSACAVVATKHGYDQKEETEKNSHLILVKVTKSVQYSEAPRSKKYDSEKKPGTLEFIVPFGGIVGLFGGEHLNK